MQMPQSFVDRASPGVEYDETATAGHADTPAGVIQIHGNRVGRWFANQRQRPPRHQPAFATGIMAVLAALAIGVVADGGPQRTGSDCPRVELSQESRGPKVQQLQRVLAEKGFDPGAIDGHFGPATQRAVIAFQQEKGVTADGSVGSDMWRKLFRKRC